ncbi:dynein heavy chain 5, axonemal, partial [Austrofundulus limnaeus]|uniref:Dynein heavy chain 5, axonemal n=1 Tax=Austrofundulus limnaeus TaxID=52670 RepID=A0A2I4D8V6_AUSLI
MYFFNDLLDQLKGPDFNAVLNVLPMASSKLIKSCNEVHRRVINGVKEAEANSCYLSSLVKHCDHLYKNDPVSMVGAIPRLIFAMKIIHRISPHYGTSEKITLLFGKVTNQMITACKAYISNNGSIWDQPQRVVVDKIKAAIHLNQEYQRVYYD